MARFLLAAALLFAAAAPGTAAAAAANAGPSPPARTLAVVPYYGPEKMWQLFSPLIDYLRRETGEPWELKLCATHDQLLADVCSGAADISLLGPVPLGRANERCGAVPFLVPRGADGSPTYHSMLVTADPAVRSVADLRGRRVGFFRGSTAAHVLPLKMLRDAGLAPGSYEAVFLQSQDALITALLEGSIVAAGVKEALYRRFQKERLLLLQTSEPVPNFAFTALPSRPAASRERFVSALAKLRPRERAADAATVRSWDDEVRNGFMPPPPDFLPAVRGIHGLTRSMIDEGP